MRSVRHVGRFYSSALLNSFVFNHPRRPLPAFPSPLFSTPLQCSCCFCSGETSSTSNNNNNDDNNNTSNNNNNNNNIVNPLPGGRLIQSLQHDQPPRGSGIQPLLDYNRQWAKRVTELDPEYFKHLAAGQNPQYLWIGCSDSRVPANEVVGLFPGDIFVHRNISNIVSNSDLNVLSVLHYAIECLKVEHIIVAGHYKCGGVKAALDEARVGLADHWILHVSSVKRRFWKRMLRDIPVKHHWDALCELNVITQLSHVVDTQLMQQAWESQGNNNNNNNNGGNSAVELHGWIYSLDDGLLRPLLSLNKDTDLASAISAAEEAVFMRYGLN